MLKEQRLQFILDYLKKEKVLIITDISQKLGVSYMTIWRDLADLESQGLLRRVRGGATAVEAGAKYERTIFPNFDPAKDRYYEQKALIGRYTAEALLDDGDNITIEAGTTASAVVPFLHHKDLTVLTNGLVTALMAAQHIPEVTVMCSGGILIETGAFIGPQAQKFFSHFRVKKALFSAQGLTLEDGFTDPTPLYSDLKRAMKANAEKTIMLLDSSKLGVRSLIQVLPLDEVNIVVTDSGANTDFVEALRQRGIEVHIAQVAKELLK